MALKKATKQPSKKKRADPQNLSPDKTPVMQGGMPQALGIRITSLSPRKVIAEMPITPMHLNLNGRVNGGAIMAFADVLGALGAVGEPAAGLSRRHDRIEDQFFASGVGPVLSAVCVPLHIGRTTSVWQTTIQNADGSKVAMVTQTQISVPAKARDPES